MSVLFDLICNIIEIVWKLHNQSEVLLFFRSKICLLRLFVQFFRNFYNLYDINYKMWESPYRVHLFNESDTSSHVKTIVVVYMLYFIKKLFFHLYFLLCQLILSQTLKLLHR